MHNDIALSVDAKCPVVLVMLDLTAAFDTVDHAVLLSRQKNYVGIHGTALKWFTSYLSSRTFSVMVADLSSSSAPLSCGVPQGSILGPILFSLYMLPLGSIIARHNLSFHCYADDLQIYLPVKPNSNSAQCSLFDCIADIKKWLAQNFLNLNDEKTECIVFGDTVSADFGTLKLSSTVRNLGVTFDSHLKFDKLSNVVRTRFFPLRLLAKVKMFLSRHDLETTSSLSRLQLVQNAAARLLTNTHRRVHITPVLNSLHRLPVFF